MGLSITRNIIRSTKYNVASIGQTASMCRQNRSLPMFDGHGTAREPSHLKILRTLHPKVCQSIMVGI